MMRPVTSTAKTTNGLNRRSGLIPAARIAVTSKSPASRPPTRRTATSSDSGSVKVRNGGIMKTRSDEHEVDRDVLRDDEIRELVDPVDEQEEREHADPDGERRGPVPSTCSGRGWSSVTRSLYDRPRLSSRRPGLRDGSPRARREAMDFGLFFLMQRDPAWSEQAVYDSGVRQMLAAESLGYHSVWLAEHHFNDYGLCPAPTVLAVVRGRPHHDPPPRHGRQLAAAASSGRSGRATGRARRR